jgi:TonB family protein
MKKYLFFLMLLSLGQTSYCQDTTYFDAAWHQLPQNLNAAYYLIVERQPNDTNKVTEHYYFITGQPKIKCSYSNFTKKIRDGSYLQWYENGHLKKEINYINGALNGQLLTFWSNGNAKRVESYDHDSLLSSNCFNSDGVETSYFPYEKNALFPGGDEALMHFLVNEIKYPKKSRRKGIEGSVIVRFVVNTEGSISHVEILQHVNQEMDEESMRVVRKMPHWEPGMIDGEPVQVAFNLPIRFKLE